MDPVLCYTGDKGKRIFRHYSLASDLFKFDMHQQVFNCGQCLFCRKRRSYELAARCVLHASLYKENCFLTLTYDESLPGYHNKFQYSDIQKFKKRLRRHFEPRKIEIYNVHEYGKNKKKHWHLICFNLSFDDKTLHTVSNSNPLYKSETLSKIWGYGFCTIGDVSEASAMYQSQYLEKDIKNQNTKSSFKSHSKHSGIGRPYFERHYDQILSLGYVPFNGRKLPVPRYFQKLAHKHWCHFFDPSFFFDNKYRKRVYTPFKTGLENKEIADLWITFNDKKQEKIREYEKMWDEIMSQCFSDAEVPDFIKSAENALYDLKNKNKQERF